MGAQPGHVHMAGDGRGRRDVFLDGKPLANVIYADTNGGVVRFHDDPPVIAPCKTMFVVREAYGVVTVVARADG